MDNTATVTEQVKEQQLHQQQLQGKKNIPVPRTMIDWKSTPKAEHEEGHQRNK